MRDGYKETKVGVIPEDWEVRKLENFAISNSYGPRFSAKLYDESGNCRVIRGTDVTKNGKVEYAEIPCASLPNEVIDKHRLEKNDFVVITTADCGVSFVFGTDGVFVPSAYMVRIRLNGEINPYFINRLFGTEMIKKQVGKTVRKGTVANLPGSELLRFKIPIPPLQEQKKIAKILSSVDEHIEEVDYMIEDLKELKKGLMQKLLTGQYSIENGKLVKTKEFKRTRLGMIPKSWEVKRLRDIADEKDRYSITGGPFGSDLKTEHYTNEGVRIIQLQNIGDGYFNNDYKIYTSDKKANELLNCNICPNDIIIAKMADPVARACKIPDYHDRYLMASDGIRLSVDKNFMDTDYTIYAINSKYFRDRAIACSTGSTRSRIGLSTLKKLELLVPILKEQQKIAKILSSVDNRIETYKNEREDLKQLKKGLMQQLLTGKKRVNINA